MCNFCSGEWPFHSTPEIRIAGDILRIDYIAHSADSSFSDTIKINFCPMCGCELVSKDN